MLYIIEFFVALTVLAGLALFGLAQHLPVLASVIFALAFLGILFKLQTWRGAAIFATAFLAPCGLMLLF